MLVQMVNTRDGSSSGSGNEAPAPPPQAPDFLDVVARQTVLLERLADAQLIQER